MGKGAAELLVEFAGYWVGWCSQLEAKADLLDACCTINDQGEFSHEVDTALHIWARSPVCSFLTASKMFEESAAERITERY